jgi:hypothetical protein
MVVTLGVGLRHGEVYQITSFKALRSRLLLLRHDALRARVLAAPLSPNGAQVAAPKTVRYASGTVIPTTSGSGYSLRGAHSALGGHSSTAPEAAVRSVDPGGGLPAPWLDPEKGLGQVAQILPWLVEVRS